MNAEIDLKNSTDKFFDLYWNNIKDERPKWSLHWDWNSELPNNGKRGCYALFKGNEIVYIGAAIGKNFADYKSKNGAYNPGGLGARLKAYWELNKNSIGKNKYIPTEKWQSEDRKLTSILTIAFDDNHFWLAAALEIYLINKLNPPLNTKHRSKINSLR
jgi:hypothetical protein